MVVTLFLALETSSPLREPAARSARRLKGQPAADAAVTVAVVASVATGVIKPTAAVLS